MCFLWFSHLLYPIAYRTIFSTVRYNSYVLYVLTFFCDERPSVGRRFTHSIILVERIFFQVCTYLLILVINPYRFKWQHRLWYLVARNTSTLLKSVDIRWSLCREHWRCSSKNGSQPKNSTVACSRLASTSHTINATIATGAQVNYKPWKSGVSVIRIYLTWGVQGDGEIGAQQAKLHDGFDTGAELFGKRGITKKWNKLCPDLHEQWH